MADDESVPRDPTVPPEHQPDPAPTSEAAAVPPASSGASAPAPVLKTRWRDRAWTFRAMLAVAAASLVIGGVAGGVIGAAAGGDDDGHERMGPGGPGMMMPPGWRHRGPGFNGPGGPRWRWNDGQPPGQQLPPYGGPSTPSPATPSPSTPSPSTPGSTG